MKADTVNFPTIEHMCEFFLHNSLLKVVSESS